MSGVVFGIFCIFYIILPEYFAVEIHTAIPLLTASRIMILMLLTAVLIKNKGIIKIGIDKYIAFFFLGICLVCMVNLFSAFSDVVKQLFRILFEQLLVIVLIYNIVDSEDKMESGIRIILYSSAVISILALVECVTGRNLFYYLTTVSREVLQASYERAGVRRAEGPFGHPVYLSVYNLLMLPFCLQFYEKTHKNKFLVIALLNCISVIASVSRGQIVILFAALLLMYVDKRKQYKFEYLKKIIWLVPGMIALLLVPQVNHFLSETIESTVVALGLKETFSSVSDRNVLGIVSRLGQVSGIWWMIQHGKVLFGFGPNAQTRGLISYWNSISNNWNVVKSFDVGYLAYALQYGIAGLIVYVGFYLTLMKKVWNERDKDDVDDWNNSFFYFYIIYFLCLFTTVGVEKVFFVITGFVNVYNRKTRRSIWQRMELI